VLEGGLAAALAGPMLVRATVRIYEATYLGSYLCVPLPALLGAAFLTGPADAAAGEEAVRVGGPVRPITQMVRQPIFIVAVLAQMVVGQGVMNLLMTGSANRRQ
jgi:hypothetical protein